MKGGAKYRKVYNVVSNEVKKKYSTFKVSILNVQRYKSV